MRIWLIHMGELVQSDGPDVRLYRLGILAEQLESRGHEVVRWIPTFVHTSKGQRFNCDTVTQISGRYQIRHIYAKGYSNHRGLARMRFHRRIARRWEHLQQGLPAPDLILAGMPTPEVCSAARRISKQRNVPFVVDVRDLWPDVFYAAAPSWVSLIARVLALPMLLSIRRSLRAATAITGVSESYVAWGVQRAGRQINRRDKHFPLAYWPPRVSAESARAASKKWRETIPEEAFVCLFLGTLRKAVDLMDVIEAARQLAVQSPGRFEWIICGDGPTRERLQTAAADLPNVTIPGWVGGPDVVALLDMASVGLAPYAKDALMSLPNKPFEYAAAGIPVVSSLTGELAELMDKHGFGTYYSSGDITHLTQIISGYANDEALRTAHGHSGRVLSETELSPTFVNRAFVEYLEEIVNESNVMTVTRSSYIYSRTGELFGRGVS
jgi:glycosyltransferase involved in cell wall biosynthesis